MLQCPYKKGFFLNNKRSVYSPPLVIESVL